MPSESSNAQRYNDYPLSDLLKTVTSVKARGGEAYLKFTCAYCGSRQAIDTPNVLYEKGKCQECEGVTDIGKTGGNLIVVYKRTRDEHVRYG